MTTKELLKIQDYEGDLWLDGLTSIPDGFNPTVGGSLYLNGLTSTQKRHVRARQLRDGDYVPGRYIYCDGILTHVKSKRRVQGYDLYIGKINGENVVSDGEFYAHCDDLREGIADIAFKRAKDRGAEQYKGLSLDTVLTLDEAKTMYRVITGACRAGTEGFAASLGDQLKDHYTIREMIEVTRGQYNAERFAEFWED